MSYYDEDFYHEPSEFDILVDQFKESLMNSVREEYVSKMDALIKENKELQEIKKNFEDIKNSYKNKERQLEFEKGNLKQTVRRERLAELMKDFEVVMYRAYSGYEKPPKCNKCDEQRRIKYKTPLGKDAYEDCECNKGKTVFSPMEYICSEFKINEREPGMIAWYKINRERDYDYASYESSTYASAIYQSGSDFKDLDRYNTFFKTKEECQSFCNYLNNKEVK